MKKILAALGLVSLIGCSNTPTCIPYCVQPNGITVPKACRKDVTKEYELQKNKHKIRVHELDRNKDQKTDLVFLIISNKKGATMNMIEDNNFDGIVDDTYIDLGSKQGLHKPDKIFDWKISAEATYKGLFNKEPNEDNLRFNSFLIEYLHHFE